MDGGEVSPRPPEPSQHPPIQDSSRQLTTHAQSHRIHGGACLCPEAAEAHQWKVIHTELLPLRPEDAYKLVFVHNKFMLDVRARRKTYKYEATAWEHENNTNIYKRIVTYTITFPSTGLGPKSSNVTELQRLSPLTRAGEVYAVNSEVVNEGIPYSDAFTILTHVCLVRSAPPAPVPARARAPADATTDTEAPPSTAYCTYSCYAHVKFNKSVWGLVKGIIDRNAYSGIEGVHADVCTALRDHVTSHGVIGGSGGGGGRVRKRRKRTPSSLDYMQKQQTTVAAAPVADVVQDGDSVHRWSWMSVIFYLFLLVVLLGLNVFLYSRVTRLEDYMTERSLLAHTIKPTMQQATDEMQLNHILFGGRLSDNRWLEMAELLQDEGGRHLQEIQGIKQNLLQASLALQTAEREIRRGLDHLPVMVMRGQEGGKAGVRERGRAGMPEGSCDEVVTHPKRSTETSGWQDNTRQEKPEVEWHVEGQRSVAEARKVVEKEVQLNRPNHKTQEQRQEAQPQMGTKNTK